MAKGSGGTNKHATNLAASRARALERRAKVAEMMVKGFTLAQTVKALGVSERTIKNDRQAIRDEFRESANWSYGEYVEIERLRLEHIGQQAFDAWENPEDEIILEKDCDGNLVSTKIKSREHDGRFLEIAIRASESRRKLLGINAEQGTGVLVNVNVHTDPNERRTRLTRLAQRLGVDPSVIEGTATETHVDYKSNGHSQNGHAKSNGKPGGISGNVEPGPVDASEAPDASEPGFIGLDNWEDI